jgi:hypothetical protein
MIRDRGLKETRSGRPGSAPRQTNPIWTVLGRKTGVWQKTNPICTARGRPWGLRIGDFGIEDGEAGPIVWTSRQTNPICHFWLHRARLSSGVRDTRCRGSRRKPRVWTECETNPMLGPRSCGELHIEGGQGRAKNKANRPASGEAGKSEIRSSKPGTNAKSQRPKRPGQLVGPVRQTKPICSFWLHRGRLWLRAGRPERGLGVGG